MSIFFSRLLSIVFHPLLMVTYCLVLLLSINPYEFGARGLNDHASITLIISIFVGTFLLPGLGVALMKPLGFIQSFDMEDRQERIMPYILTGIFYLWVFKNLIGPFAISGLFAQLMLGATIGLFATFFINLFTKISAHAAGVGGMVGAIFAIMRAWGSGAVGLPFSDGTLSFSLNALLVIAIFIAGMVGSARMVLKAHTLEQVLMGYAVGLAAQTIASIILG